MSRLGFVGTGHIAAAMVRFLTARGHDFAVTERNRSVSMFLARDADVTVAEPQAVVDGSDVLFLCLRPNVAAEVIGALDFRRDQRIVSVMAGIPRATLERLCAPATTFVQTIPLSHLERGGCPLAAFGDSALLSELFEPDNPVVEVSTEAALNAHFAVTALVPGVLDILATGAGWLREQTGDAVGTEFYTTQLIDGFLAAMEKESAGRLAAERDAMATEDTLSLQMVEGLRGGGMQGTLIATMDAIRARLEDAA